jgi:hypothetical protein
MEPMTTLAIASALMQGVGGFMGGGGGQEREGYSGSVSPNRTLEDAMRAIKGFGSNLESRGPARLRTTMAPPPSPVSIPGLPFQIGGGLGTDPAILDPSILMGRPGAGSEGQGTPLQSLFKSGSGSAAPGQRGVNRRTPASGNLMPKPQPESF